MKKYFLIQKNMIMMLIALTPLILFSIFLFGWRILVLLLVTTLAAAVTEFLFIRRKPGGKISMAALVTGFLLALSSPPTLPFWMAAVAAIVAITFGKMVFGGFGMNVFNPAMLGRTFIYVSFARAMTVSWLQPFTAWPGGFATWMKAEHLTAATPMIIFRDSGIIEKTSNLFFGFIAGSAGETSVFLILLSGLFLLITKTARWQAMLSTLISFLLFGALFYSMNPLPLLLSGGLMFGVVFITTDPVSMPKKPLAIWIYGFLIGFLTIFIRKYSLFVEGFMFAVIITNSFMPIIEYGLSKLPRKGA